MAVAVQRAEAVRTEVVAGAPGREVGVAPPVKRASWAGEGSVARRVQVAGRTVGLVVRVEAGTVGSRAVVGLEMVAEVACLAVSATRAMAPTAEAPVMAAAARALVAEGVAACHNNNNNCDRMG